VKVVGRSGVANSVRDRVDLQIGSDRSGQIANIARIDPLPEQGYLARSWSTVVQGAEQRC
jgi:hypothetical protein